MLSNIAAATAVFAATASAFTCEGNYFSFFNRGGAALSYASLDPALFPGTASPHLHSFDGGNALSATTDFKATQGSSCSTNRVKTDKSLYWRPTLFFKDNQGYHRVPEQYTKIYYKYGESGPNANVTGFPENFNMITGSPLKRSEGENNAGVRWACHQPDGSDKPIFSEGFPKGFSSCKYGFASEVTFPSCWNGQKLDPKNANAHMAFPVGGKCPESHSAARFPTIFIEFWYDVSSFKWSADQVPWVLSNGDPTGFGFHADFLNGWVPGVLEKATSPGGCTCGCGCGQEQMEKCFGKENVNNNNDAEFKQCSVKDNASIKEAPSVYETLPGCNPIQAGPSSATAVTGPNCAVTAAPAPGGDKAPTASSSAKASSKADTYSSQAVKDNANTKPSQSPKAPIKQNEGAATPVPSQQYSEGIKATPKPESIKTALPTLSLAQSSAPAQSSGAPAGAPALSSGLPAGGDGKCKAPVYVTVTPTIYVTAGSNSTSCGLGTVTKTLTQTATVTMPAQDGIAYMSA